MTDYTGICISGPLDGEFAASPTSRFKAWYKSKPPTNPYDITTYKHTVFESSFGPVEVWLPDGMITADVIHHLVFAHYNNTSRCKNN